MMKLAVVLAILFFPKFTSAQEVRTSGIVSPYGDTSGWYEYQKRMEQALGLPALDTSCHHKYLRISIPGQIIDVRESAAGAVSGSIISWVSELAPGNETQTGRMFSVRQILTPDTATAISRLFWSGLMPDLPTDDSIKNWSHGFDGATFIIEQSAGCEYALKSYWTPSAQDSLKEALIVQHFIDSAFAIANADYLLRLFGKTIPYECYTTGGMGVSCKILTDKQKRKYAAERRRYLSRRKK